MLPFAVTMLTCCPDSLCEVALQETSHFSFRMAKSASRALSVSSCRRDGAFGEEREEAVIEASGEDLVVLLVGLLLCLLRADQRVAGTG